MRHIIDLRKKQLEKHKYTSLTVYNIILSYGFLLGTLIILCVFMSFRIDYLIDSDMSAELILAKLLAEDNRFALTENWYYPSEVRVFHVQWIMALLFRLFSNWHLVRVLGSIIVYLLYLASYWCFCREAGLQKYFAVSAAFLLLPFSPEYCAVFLYGLFYIPHMILAFLILGMSFHLRRGTGICHAAILWAMIGVLSLLGGLGGQRVPAVFHAPFGITTFIWFALRRWRCGKYLSRTERQKDTRTLAVAAYAAMCAFCGLMLNQTLLSQKYTFRSYQFVKPCIPSLKQLAKVLEGWLRTLGLWTPRSVWPSDWPASGELLLQTYSPLQIAVSVALAFALCAAFWISMFRPVVRGGQVLATTSFETWFTTSFLFCGGVLLTGLFFVTTMEFTVRYLLTTTVFAIPVLSMFFKNVPLESNKLRLLCGGLICLVLVSCISIYAAFWQLDLTREEREIVQELTSDGYTEGYSTFWSGDVLTELSNGDVQVWVWDDASLATSEPQIFVWNQRADHSTARPDGKCFVLLTKEEADYFSLDKRLDESRLSFKTERYLLYLYNSSDELYDDLKTN